MCWIAESPFVGGCSYLLRSTTFRQLVAKGGTLGWSTVACCVFTAITWIAATLADFLKAPRPIRRFISEVTSWRHAGMKRKRKKKKLLWTLDSRGRAEGMLGLTCDSALQAKRKGCPVMMVSFRDPEIVSCSVTQQLHSLSRAAVSHKF